jgi:hypothetical protein
MVSFLKLKILSTLIMITLLSTLPRFHVFSNQLNLLSSLLNNVRSQYHTLTGLIPIQRSSTFPAIQRFERCHSNARMVIVIISELDQWKMTILSSSLLKYTNSQQVLQRLNCPLRLSICLRMIRRTQTQLRTQRLLQTLLKSRSKSWISI